MRKQLQLLRYLARAAFVFLFFAALYLSLSNAEDTPSLELSWDKLNHAFGYFLLVASLDAGFRTGRHLFSKSAFVFLYSVLIEVAQYFFPYREFSLLDMTANAVGIAFFLILLPHLKRIPIYQSLVSI